VTTTLTSRRKKKRVVPPKLPSVTVTDKRKNVVFKPVMGKNRKKGANYYRARQKNLTVSIWIGKMVMTRQRSDTLRTCTLQ